MITFRGGALDGEVHPIAYEDLSADWDPSCEAYVVSDEDGEPRETIEAMPAVADPYRTRRRIAIGLAISALLINSSSFFLGPKTSGVVVGLALVLLWIGFWLKP